jgi:hypothetical protein
MNRYKKRVLPVMALVISVAFQLGTAIQAQPPMQQPPGAPGPQRPALPPITLNSDTTHTLTRYFTPASGNKKAPNEKGFIQRWLVLEPVKKDIARNSIFTDTYLRTTFSTDNFSPDYNTVPKGGETVKVGTQDLKWYALDSKTFNFNLYHFTYAIDKPRFGILEWVVTVIDCPEEMQNVRLAAGCNSASMWWLNGQEALKKGRNIIRGAVINGPGMCNFCVRFLDEKGAPIRNINISTE